MNTFVIEDPQVRQRVEELGLATCKWLGGGGTGNVYLASGVLKGTNVDRTYAVKVIKKDRKDSLEREIKVSAMLKDRPIKGTVSVFHAELVNETHGLVVMEYMNTDLRKYLSEKKFLTEQETKGIITQLLVTIHEMNARGYIHRDIKPANILMKETKDGLFAKLGDFGEVREFCAAPRSNRAELTIIGTVGFASPEVISGVYGEKIDMWSTGVVMYQMLYGHAAFNCCSQGEYIECLKKYTADRNVLQPKEGISAPCFELLCKLMDTNEETRWSCEEALNSTFISKSITLWHVVPGPVPSFGKLKLTKKDINVNKHAQNITWRDLSYFVMPTGSEAKGKHMSSENLLVITRNGICMDPDQVVDGTGLFDRPVEAIFIFDEVKPIRDSIEIKPSETEETVVLDYAAADVDKILKKFSSNMNLGRTKAFLDEIFSLTQSGFGPLFGVVEACKDVDVAVRAACTAFSGAVQGDLNMALVRLIEKLSMFSGTENIVVRTLLPIVRKDTLNDFMESCGLNDIVKEAKGLIKNVSTLREEVLKTSRTKSFAMMTKDHSKKEEEKEQRSAEKEEVMSGEEIYKNGLKSAETLKALFERARGLAIADLQGKFAEIWNFFVSALRALKTVKKMQSMVSKVASLNVRSEVMNGRFKYEESVTELLGEFKGCVASPYIPDYEDKIRALQKECDELRAKNAELKTKLMNG